MLISPASVSIRFTSVFSRVVSTGGGVAKTIAFCVRTGVKNTCESFCGFMICIMGAWLFAGAEATFFGKGFNVAGGRFATIDVLGAGTTKGGCFTHSLKVISSNTKSFPQPPGLLLIIINVSAVSEGGVVKIARYRFQYGASRRGTSPVRNCAMFFPAGVCSCMVILGNSVKGQGELTLHTFISHSENSYVVPLLKPLSVVVKNVPLSGDEFTSSIFPDTSPGV